jgi:hypothetical protein
MPCASVLGRPVHIPDLLAISAYGKQPLKYSHHMLLPGNTRGISQVQQDEYHPHQAEEERHWQMMRVIHIPEILNIYAQPWMDKSLKGHGQRVQK